jgi:hypothetical protein
LYAMSSGAALASSNNRAGASILTYPTGYYWSSTEMYNNAGRYHGGYSTSSNRVVCTLDDGSVANPPKSNNYPFRCVWRN